MDANSLFIGMLTGAIGTGYVVWAKKQSKLVPAICGVLLMIYPYFIDSLWGHLIIGTALVVAPFVIKST